MIRFLLCPLRYPSLTPNLNAIVLFPSLRRVNWFWPLPLGIPPPIWSPWGGFHLYSHNCLFKPLNPFFKRCCFSAGLHTFVSTTVRFPACPRSPPPTLHQPLSLPFPPNHIPNPPCLPFHPTPLATPFTSQYIPELYHLPSLLITRPLSSQPSLTTPLPTNFTLTRVSLLHLFPLPPTPTIHSPSVRREGFKGEPPVFFGPQFHAQIVISRGALFLLNQSFDPIFRFLEPLASLFPPVHLNGSKKASPLRSPRRHVELYYVVGGLPLSLHPGVCPM